MAAQTPPIFLQAGSHPAEDVRRAFTGLLGGRQGILTFGSMVVSQKSGTPNMSVDVAEGQVAVSGDEGTYSGTYLCEARGVTNLAIAAANVTNPRWDLIIARVRDSAYSGAVNAFSLEVVTGTAAASPSDPSLPTGSVFVIARVVVAASASSIVTGNVTDLRTTYTGKFGRAAAIGGIITCTSTTRPPSPYTGMEIFETDTRRRYVYHNSAWIIPHPLGRLNHATLTSDSANFTGTIVYPLSVTATPLANRLLRITVHANVYSTAGGTTVSVSVCNNAGTILNQAYRAIAYGTVAEQVSVDLLTTSGGGGGTTWKIGAFANSSSKIQAAGTAATYISVYDEGPT